MLINYRVLFNRFSWMVRTVASILVQQGWLVILHVILQKDQLVARIPGETIEELG
jgi:hypothetical protein